MHEKSNVEGNLTNGGYAKDGGVFHTCRPVLMFQRQRGLQKSGLGCDLAREAASLVCPSSCAFQRAALTRGQSLIALCPQAPAAVQGVLLTARWSVAARTLAPSKREGREQGRAVGAAHLSFFFSVLCL